MDAASLSDISSSMAEFLEKEKIYKELCRSITEGVSPHEISINTPRDKSLTPDDEINALLKQMNQILSPDGKEDILGSSEERSVEVILKEAEDLIRSSTPLFVNISSGSSTKTWPPPQRKLTAPCNITQTITKADDNESLSDNSENEVEVKELEGDQQMANSNNSDTALTTSSSTAKSGNRSSYSISEANDQIFKNIVNRKKRKTNTNRKASNKFTKAKQQDQLLLSDLAIPSVEISKLSKNVSPQEEPTKPLVRSQEPEVQGEANDFEKENVTQKDQLKISYDEQTFDLKKEINVLNSKLQEYEHSGRDRKREAENLVAAQQRQIEMLEAELRTQEQLIAGFQRENHKLCQEMSAAKSTMTLLLWLMLMCLSLVLAQERVSYNGSQILQVKAVSDSQRNKLIQLQDQGVLELWNINVTSGELFVRKSKLGVVKDQLQKDKLEFKVLAENLQENIDNENPLTDKEKSLSGRLGNSLTFDRYYRMADIHGYLDYLAETYPQFVQLQTIGFSVEGLPLKVIKISSGAANPKSVWIDGGIHAREWISVASVTYIISELVENRNAHLSYTNGIDYYILPIFNPDGYEYSHTTDRLWRKNRSKSPDCIGTDLNRNWDYNWRSADTSSNCSEVHPGQSAFSEPETWAAAQFILSHASNMKAYLSFHTYGQLILLPLSSDENTTVDYADLVEVGTETVAAIASATGSAYRVALLGSASYPAYGNSCKWIKNVGNVKYSYTIELQDTGYYGFILPPSYIRSSGTEALAAVEAISLAVQQTS